MAFSKSVEALVFAAKHIVIEQEREAITFQDLAEAARALDECRLTLASIFKVNEKELPLEKVKLAGDWQKVRESDKKIRFASGVRKIIADADGGQNLESLLTALILHPQSGLAPLDVPDFKFCIEEMKKLDLNDDQACLETLRFTVKEGLFEKIQSEPTLVRKGVITEVEKRIQQQASESHEENTTYALLKRISNIRGEFEDIVIGQPDAIEAVCDGLSRQIYRTNENTPAAVFLFVGPSATGKTLLATSLAETMGGDWKSISVQMETMTSQNQGFEINGLSKGYTNAGPGHVTDFVRKNPHSVVVFENFDKAHPNVRSIIEPMFATGVLVDQHGFFKKDSDGDYNYSKKIAEPEVSFSDAIVIFTTNAGEEAYDSPGFQKVIEKRKDQIESILLNELTRLDNGAVGDGVRSRISSTFIGGLATGSTVLFRKLAIDSLARCAERSINKTLLSLQQGLGIEIKCEQIDLVSKALLLSFSPDVSALTAGNDLVERLVDPLMDYIRDHQGEVPSDVRIVFAKDQQKQLQNVLSSFEDSDPIEQMFRKNKTLHIVIQASAHDDQLILEIGDIVLQRVSHAHDFRGAGAVRAEVPDVSFEKIAGHHVVKKRMGEIVKLLKKPGDIKTLGVDMPKGLLLWGPPGTGKTLLAKALAHEADLPFISTTGSELLNLDFIKQTFKRARKYAPSILFIDEIDAIGSRGFSTQLDVIINQLLIEIDGFDTSLSAPVFIVAATNLPEKIDGALTRSGRIDLKVEVPMLDRDARTYFIEQYFKLPHDGSLDRDSLLNFTAGMSGADLEMVKREAVLEMVSAGQSKVTMEMLTEQINTIKYGVRSINPRLLQSLDATAYHEAGHAIVSMVVNPDVLIEQVTVMPREGALGFVSYDVESAQYRQINRQEVLDTMCVALAGRIAQTRQFPEHGDDSGASSDLKKATAWATHAITNLGLDEEIGNVILSPGDKPPSLAAGGMLFERVQAWVKEAEALCSKIIEDHWDKIDQLAKDLIKNEVITGEQLREDFVL